MRAQPLSFVVCVNDEDVLRQNLLASHDLRGATPHEIIPVRGASSAAEGLNAGIERARHKYVVLVHQDVHLPKGWADVLFEQLRIAQWWLGKVGVAGVYGACYAPDVPSRVACAGHVIDRGQERHEPHELPAEVETLDELLLVVPKATPHRFDPNLGWHLYGADFACQVRSTGAIAAALDAPCYHNSRSGTTPPAAFMESVAYFKQKWQHALPVVTPCVIME